MSTVLINYRIILVGGTLALVGLLRATHSGWRVIPLALKQYGNRLTTQRIRDVVKEAAIEAGVMEPDTRDFRRKFTPHTFRTVFTTLMRQQNMSNRIIQYLRGDSNSDMVDLYTRVGREEAREEYLNSMKDIGL